MNRSAHISKTKLFTIIMLFGTLLVSCDSILDMPKEDCTVTHLLKFKYDRNMKFADAFANEVKSIAVYAFDSNGKYLFTTIDQGSHLSQPDYALTMPTDLTNLQLITWAGYGAGESFTLPQLTPGVSTLTDLQCAMNRDRITSSEGSLITDDLHPLFHGSLSHYSTTRNAYTSSTTVSLTKNTNNIRIVLQQMSSEPIDIDQFRFKIYDQNGLMNFDNTLLDDEQLIYQPWSITGGSAQTPDSPDSQVNVCIAEFTTGRLCTQMEPRLVVTNPNNETIISIPIIDYALLVKGNYHRQMDDQEYLDRQDEYNMIFFLDKNNQWVSSSIIINGWQVVLNNSDI